MDSVYTRNKLIKQLYRALDAIHALATSTKRVDNDADTLCNIGFTARVNLDEVRDEIAKLDPPLPFPVPAPTASRTTTHIYREGMGIPPFTFPPGTDKTSENSGTIVSGIIGMPDKKKKKS